MKKIVIMILVVAMAVFALASCNNNKKPAASTPKPVTSGSVPESTPIIPPASSGETVPPETQPIAPELTFDTRSEDVYVYNAPGGLKLRTTTSFAGDSNVASIVDEGTKLTRIGVGVEDALVSKVVYNGKEYYCGSRYLTTDAPQAPGSETKPEDTEVVFEDRNETVYVYTGVEDGQCTVYSKAYKGWSAGNKQNVINDLRFTEGTELTRTGICYEDPNDLEVGWSRVEYNGTTYYVRNSVLSTQAPTTDAPATGAPATAAPATEAPATEAPATEAPVTEAPATNS